MGRPINADLPPAKEAESVSQKTPGARVGRRRRKPIPGALKAIGGLFALAIVFIVAAILGGGGGSEDGATVDTPAPVVEAPEGGKAPAPATPQELGYPAIATANTTRVGGGDPAAIAAAVALAVHPSTQPGQRPPAVAIVSEDDWQTAIAAAALAAPPLRAPILIADGDGLLDPSEEALASLDPEGGRASGGAQAFAIGGAALPDGLASKRVGGTGAAGAAAIAHLRERLPGPAPRHVVIAPTDPALAMPAAAWAARSGDPVLFVSAGGLPAPTGRYLRAHPRLPVYVLGPSSAIPSDVVREIGSISRRVRRVSGEDPVANAIEFARYGDGSFGWNVNDPGHGFVVARDADPLDAAAAAPLSAAGSWGPLLLSDDAATLPEALRGYLLDVKPGYTTDPTRAFYNHIWVIGDQEAIDVQQQAEIDELAELAKIGGEP